MSEVPIMVMPWHRPDPCKPLKMQTSAAFKASYMDYLGSLSLESPPLAIPLTGIMCTIGPSSNNVDMMVDLMTRGMTLALVPLALGLRQDHIDTIAKLRVATTTYSTLTNRVFPLAIAVQTKGPGLRIGGLMKDMPIDLPLHHRIILTTDKTWRLKGTEHYLYIGFPEMCDVLREGDVLLLGNGTVLLQIDRIDGRETSCKVVSGGTVTSFMAVSVPDVPLNLPPITDEDVDDLKLVASLGVDIIIVSRTQNASHLKDVRKILSEEENGSGIKLWAQLESRQGLDNLESILNHADGILLSRISLIQDLPANKLFLAQKIIIGTCNKVGVPVFVSSHFLPSMQTDVTPSIAEVNDVATTILDGADGFVLRNTTSIGKHPHHTVKMLAELCVEAEAAVWHYQTFSYLNNQAVPPIDPTHAIAISAVEACLKAQASAILLATTSGRSAQLVARYRPRCPIVAVTRYGQVARQLNTWRAIVPIHYVDPPLPDWTREVDVRLQYGIEFLKHRGLLNPGDTIVLLNGWRKGAGFTNTIRLVYVSDSFPWVYPHKLPSVIPDDKDIESSEERLSPSSTHQTLPKSKSKEIAAPSGADLLSSVSRHGKVVLQEQAVPTSKTESFLRSMESEFQTVAVAKSKEFERNTLLQEIEKSTSHVSETRSKAKSTADSTKDSKILFSKEPSGEKLSVTRKSMDEENLIKDKLESKNYSNISVTE